MCMYEGKEINSDVGRIIKKYDIYYCNLGSIESNADGNLAKIRPCIIMSSDDINHVVADRYTVVPLRTEHSMVVDTAEKAEEIVKMRRESGRIYVPVKMQKESGCYGFADITQIRPVRTKDIYAYYRTITNPDVKIRLDKEIDSYLGRGIHEFVKNYIMNDRNSDELQKLLKAMNGYIEHGNMTYSDEYDVTAFIKKFDVYRCDVGSNKTVKYVVLQSDIATNDYRKQCMVAPIYKESPKPVTDANLKEYLNLMAAEGSMCVPFHASSSDEYSFVNLSKLHYLPFGQMKKYEHTIVNESVRKDINDKLMRLFFNDGEYSSIENKIEVTDAKKAVSNAVEILPSEKETETIQDEKLPIDLVVSISEEQNNVAINTASKYPSDWELVYNEYISNKWTAKEAADLLDLKLWKFYELSRQYRAELRENGISVKVKRTKTGGRKPTPIPAGFSMYYNKMKAGTITKSEVCKKYNISRKVLNEMIKHYESARSTLVLAN